MNRAPTCSAAPLASLYADMHDAPVRSAEQPAEQFSIDPESRINPYVSMYHQVLSFVSFGPVCGACEG